MRNKVSARQRALRAQAAVVAERAAKDKRLLDAATEWFTVNDKLEQAREHVTAQENARAAIAARLLDDERLTLDEAAQLLDLDTTTELSALRKQHKDTESRARRAARTTPSSSAPSAASANSSSSASTPSAATDDISADSTVGQGHAGHVVYGVVGGGAGGVMSMQSEPVRGDRDREAILAQARHVVVRRDSTPGATPHVHGVVGDRQVYLDDPVMVAAWLDRNDEHTRRTLDAILERADREAAHAGPGDEVVTSSADLDDPDLATNTTTHEHLEGPEGSGVDPRDRAAAYDALHAAAVSAELADTTPGAGDETLAGAGDDTLAGASLTDAHDALVATRPRPHATRTTTTGTGQPVSQVRAPNGHAIATGAYTRTTNRSAAIADYARDADLEAYARHRYEIPPAPASQTGPVID